MKIFGLILTSLSFVATIASADTCWFCDANGSGAKDPTYVDLITQPFGFGTSAHEAAPLAMDQCQMLYKDRSTCQVTSCYQAAWDYACSFGGGGDLWCAQHPEAPYCSEGNFCQWNSDDELCRTSADPGDFCRSHVDDPACKKN